MSYTSSKVSDFKSIALKLASPEKILEWSHGEVTKPETINYRTQRAEKDGLFCERIFGPEKDYECYCGKYRRIRYKGIVCDKCGVEVTKSIVRRERMGHIRLVVPVAHIWFLRGVPSKMGLVLDRSIRELEQVVYFVGYIITNIDEEERANVIKAIDQEYKGKVKEKDLKAQEKVDLREQRDIEIKKVKSLYLHQILSETDYRDLSMKYGQIFDAGTGSEVLRKIFEQTNLESLANELRDQAKRATAVIKKKIQKRLYVVEGMIRANIRPEWMFFTVLPVLPPELRPMVQLEGGRYAASDVNDLYRRVINRNNRLKRLLELNAPEVICRNEKRMLQEAVDALIDNGSRRQVTVAASTGQKRILKSLADGLKGKQGRFRQNLLGKRVDYSGRSVIVVGPELKLHQCGLPKYMALELFKPFIINKLIERELAHNVRGAGRLIEAEVDEVWGILEEVTRERYVLLNRAPTLHRLGIQAFQPVLIEGKAIRVHPLVCAAFNADFDGDQMAVHLPLSNEAQDEAKNIMLSSHNLLKPATGNPVVVPTKDIVLGCYWMTRIQEGLKGEGKIFSSSEEALLAKHFGAVHLKARIKVRLNPEIKADRDERGLVETSVGRIIFNEPLPSDRIGFVNQTMKSRDLRNLVGNLIDVVGTDEAGEVLDRIKRMGFKYATDSGISWSMSDLVIPEEKEEWLNEARQEVKQIQDQYDNGFLTDDERKTRVIQAWLGVTDRISKRTPESIDHDGSVFNIFDSGARCSIGQLNQMTGMKGLVVNPSGEIIELPIQSSYKEGFSILEYFISTHGGRKGLADTALKTAQAGYLTRRLVDVCQDIIVREKDCGDKTGIYVYREDSEEIGSDFESRVMGRVSLDTIKIDGKTIVKKDEMITKDIARKIDGSDIEKVRVRSVITCQAPDGVCQRCYGYDLGRNKLIEMGEAIGIVTAQAIGEPATQLTLRTFHIGGIAGGQDITQGLPRVEEIFEVRTPRGKAIVSEVDGRVKDIVKHGNQTIIQIDPVDTTGKKKLKVLEYTAPANMAILVEKGDVVGRGSRICEGHIDLEELYKLAGAEAVQRYIIREVQQIYSFAGENVSDKHIEMIIRQMFSRVKVVSSGSTSFMPGEVVAKSTFKKENAKMSKKGQEPAVGQEILLGVTKAALTSDSFLSAVSFIETARILIDAAVRGRKDELKGLKENVIVGRLIPAGTGFNR